MIADYKFFFLAVAIAGGSAALVAAILSTKMDYRPNIKSSYGDTSWVEPKDL